MDINDDDNQTVGGAPLPVLPVLIFHLIPIPVILVTMTVTVVLRKRVTQT
jgi:hypothetical protein